MALPKLLQKLFQNGGAGDKLRPDIVPITLNGNEPDANGNFTAEQTGCLPLSGGTMTGHITFNNLGASLHKSTDTDFLVLRGGTNSSANGSSVYLYGKNHETKAGWIEAVAHDSTNVKALIGKPDGTLTWGGKKVELVNSSGDKWIRYENGLQICWGFQSISSSTKITYAVPFTDNVIVQVGGKYVGSSYYVAIPDSNKTTCSFTVVKISSGLVELPPADAPSFSWLAIGRWK